MTKIEFFNIIITGLKDFPETKLQEIISYYETRFSIETSYGKTDAQIIKEIGDPYLLIDQYRNGSLQSNICKTTFHDNSIYSTENTLENCYSNDKLKDNDKLKNNNHFNTNTLLKIGIFILVLTLFSPMISWFTTHNINSYFYNKAINLDFNFNLNESIIYNEQPINENIHSIEFNLTNQDIQLKNYFGDSIKIQIKSDSLSTPTKLSAIEIDNKLIFTTTPNNISDATILISIPYTLSNKSNVNVTTSSGDINISNLSPNSLTLSTGSGYIDIYNTNLNSLSVITSSSTINLNNVNSLEKTELISNSGNIKFTGNPNILNCNSTSGDIDITVKDILSDTSLNSLSGDISLSLPKNCGYKINYETLSGHFTSPNNSLSSGDESSIINLRTVSGDISMY